MQHKWLLISGIIGLGLVVFLVITLNQKDDTTPPASSSEPTSSDGGEIPSTLPADQTADQTAVYTIKYDVSWSPETHPRTLPANAHVSPLVVVAHAEENDLFAPDTLATDGIEMMAETGATSVLIQEVDADTAVSVSAVGVRLDVPASNTLELAFTQDFPLLSAVSMLAPSPDWFVAARNVELFKDGQWVEEVQVTMKPYDAGTDSVETFSTADIDTLPPEFIQMPQDETFIQAAQEGNFATLIITKNP